MWLYRTLSLDYVSHPSLEPAQSRHLQTQQIRSESMITHILSPSMASQQRRRLTARSKRRATHHVFTRISMETSMFISQATDSEFISINFNKSVLLSVWKSVELLHFWPCQTLEHRHTLSLMCVCMFVGHLALWGPAAWNFQASVMEKETPRTALPTPPSPITAVMALEDSCLLQVSGLLLLTDLY